MPSASSSRLGRKPQKRTLTLVQLPFLGLIGFCHNKTILSAADLVVIGHPSAAALTKDQVADIFPGKNLNMMPVKALWSRLVFSGKAQQLPKELPDSAAVKKAVAAAPKAIGYIEKAAVDVSIKVITQLN